MKLIDADRLLAEIERWKELITKIECEANKKYCIGYADAIKDILHTITSLQQEQPAVDLEKEMDKYYDSPLWDGENVSWMTYTRIARHFYELGQRTKYQQDREEFAKLKAKEWQEGYDEGFAKGINARKEE